MKRIFFFFFLLTASVAVNAQAPATTQEAPKATAEERAHSQTLRMQKILTLSTEQVAKVEQVILTRIKTIDALRADQTKTKDVKKAEVAAANATQDAELQKILTPEQYTKYVEQKKMKEERRNLSGQ